MHFPAVPVVRGRSLGSRRPGVTYTGIFTTVYVVTLLLGEGLGTEFKPQLRD